MELVQRKRLQEYLQDHLTLSMAGLELAKRCLRNNPKGELGNFLRTFVSQIPSERAWLRASLVKLGGEIPQLKLLASWMLEKLMPLKFNAFGIRHTRLSRVFELETLLVGVRGKLNMYRILDEGARSLAWEVGNPGPLLSQAEWQVKALQEFCMRAAGTAFGFPRSAGTHPPNRKARAPS